MTMDYRVLPYGAGAPATVRDLARLHATLLPASPVSLLGRRFMENFYYRVLPREGLAFGAVAYVNEQPAGFVAATHDRNGFMRTAVRHYWPHLLWVIGVSVLTAPKSLGAIWQAWRVMSSRRRAEGGEPEGEILSLGVLPAYREPGFDGWGSSTLALLSVRTIPRRSCSTRGLDGDSTAPASPVGGLPPSSLCGEPRGKQAEW